VTSTARDSDPLELVDACIVARSVLYASSPEPVICPARSARGGGAGVGCGRATDPVQLAQLIFAAQARVERLRSERRGEPQNQAGNNRCAKNQLRSRR